MAVSKVILNGTTLIDLTQDTVVTTHVVDDDTFHDAAGVASAGTMPVYAGANRVNGYQITVSLTNPISPSDFTGCVIDELITNHKDIAGNYDDTQSLGTIQSASGSMSVILPITSYGVLLTPMSNWSVSYSSSDISVDGDISFIEKTLMATAAFEVTGDGTITIDGIDYGD